MTSSADDQSALVRKTADSDDGGHPSTGIRRLPTEPGCHYGKHVASDDITIDTLGVDHARCRDCGCELTRMAMVGRWFRSGKMG